MRANFSSIESSTSSTLRRAGPAALAAFALLGVLAASAGAQADEGVFVDPGTPAGKEYAIPLEQARREATGKDPSGVLASRRRPRAAVGGTAGPPLFGVGIAPSNSRGEGSSASRRGRSGSGSLPEAAARADALTDPGDDSSATLPTAGIALAILLAGGALGLVLRRGLGGS